MSGNIFITECSSVVSCLGCRRTTLGGESSGRLGTGTSPGLEPVSPHSDLIKLPFEVPRFFLEPRGWPTTTSLGMEVVGPSTQHIPTTVILCEPSCSGTCGCWGCCWCCGVSAVWPSGLSPRGVASFVHARLGARGYQGRMVSNLPSPCLLNLLPVAPGCPRGVRR